MVEEAERIQEVGFHTVLGGGLKEEPWGPQLSSKDWRGPKQLPSNGSLPFFIYKKRTYCFKTKQNREALILEPNPPSPAFMALMEKTDPEKGNNLPRSHWSK